jgi:cell division transport system permease protein
MTENQQKPRKKSFFNLHFTTTISVALVLFMVGLISFLFIFTKEMTDYAKENLGFSIVLDDGCSDKEVKRIENYLSQAPFVKSYVYVSKEQALADHVADLGEDPTKFLGYNPLQASIEVKLHANSTDSAGIASAKNKISVFSGIQEVVYQEDVVQLLNKNVRRISLIFGGITLILLFISIALINNTIRITVYSDRFLINTMKLVGAKAWFIRKPFIKKNLTDGFWAALLAIIMLAGAVYYVQSEIGATLNLYQTHIWLPVVIIVFVMSFFIIFFAALFGVNRFLRLKTDDLYYI